MFGYKVEKSSSIIIDPNERDIVLCSVRNCSIALEMSLNPGKTKIVIYAKLKKAVVISFATYDNGFAFFLKT